MASAQYFPLTLGGDRELVVDEFTCPTGVKRLVESLQPMVERVFRVKFAIGGEEEAFPGNDQTWLKMTGDKTEVEAAKLFVKGLVNQEEQQEISYPETLNCVFCGAGGLFMDCLIRNTSALMVTISQGSMLVSGLMEPVVQAYSLILTLLEKYRANHRQSIEAGVEVLGNGLDSCPAFKALVKQWSDRHTWDLLLLPRPVQEILLNVVRESRMVIDGGGPGFTFVEGYREAGEAERSALRDFARCSPWDKEGYVQGHTHLESPYLYNGRMIGCPQVPPFHQPQCQTIQEFSGEKQHLEERNVGGLKESVAPESSFQVVAPNRGPLQSPEVEDRGYRHGPQELGEEEGPTLSVGSAEEFGLQLNFLTAMGYSEDVVKRVLAKTGPKEVSQILDLVQQEQDKKAEEERVHILTGHTQSGVGRWGEEEDAAEDPSGETEEDSDEEQSGGNGGQRGAAGVVTGEGESQENATAVGKDDFVLGVLKNAAASCGYPEERVMELYDNLPGLSTGDLLKELQKEAMRGRGKGKEMGRGVGRGAGRHREAYTSPAREHKRGTKGRGRHEKKSHRTSESGDVSSDAISTDSQLPQSPGSNVRGPPKPSYPPGVPPVLNAFSLLSGKSEDQPGLVNVTAAAMVTGEQRFLDSLSAPFDLKLTDDPGDLSLRRVIIDGSNVAMSHGLWQFFSCRGIAIAVQFFWNRGHRNVTTFVPMWRLKRHPKVTEQHFLTDLQNLGLLSFTPSREVQGKRIDSYDNRFMLHLAQKTDGVIVTNDNLRDLLDESPAWRDIIKRRLLQYTFVGDLFMVPDDPLGRGGPHLKDFLRSQDRSPVPGSHTFAGLGSHFPPPSTPNAQTEVLQYRDRTVGIPPHRGGLHGFEGGRGRGQSRGKGRGGVRTEPVHMSGGKERSAAQTSNLRKQLCQVFKGEDSVVTMVLSCNPSITDTNSLSNIILQVLEERARNI